MGNCVFRGFSGVGEVIKVVTSNGGIMELYAPITAECITNEFPSHGIFHSRDLFSQPLLHNDELLSGELYYLLPLKSQRRTILQDNNDAKISRTSSVSAPYRMSFDSHGIWRRSETEIFPRYNNNSSGVWKVKLVISPEQLTEILSQEAKTEELIESVRTVAKCGNGFPSAANSDQWSISSSWKALSENMA
ncbi:uvrABC system protein C [Tasmannia lanceolata]|uniref:uvrABC system protein C n=1 Tax=Tasmannia lanceolata TaxID=3420 RepID=UPI00406463CA